MDQPYAHAYCPCESFSDISDGRGLSDSRFSRLRSRGRKTETMRILVVDDHELVRRGICWVLASEPTITLCGEAVDGQDAVEKTKALRPDIVVMDVNMPRLNGLDATREIKKLLPETEIVIVSQHEAPETMRQAF